MPQDPLRDFVPVLQTAVGPVILISGVGLLLLSMTNRYGRVIDRARDLTKQLRASGVQDRHRFVAEIDILLRRASGLRAMITCAAGSALSAAVLVGTLFLGVLLHWDASLVVAVLFLASLGLLCLALLLFLFDLRVSLNALRMEAKAARLAAERQG